MNNQKTNRAAPDAVVAADELDEREKSAFDSLRKALGEDAPPVKEAVEPPEDRRNAAATRVREAVDETAPQPTAKAAKPAAVAAGAEAAKPAKKRTGRPRKFPENEVYIATQVYLTDSERARLASIGGGNNRSEGVRRLLRWHEAENLPDSLPVGN